MEPEKVVGVLGDYIERVKEVIPYNKEIPVKGLSVDKKFIETNIANLDGIVVPLQLVKKGQFAYAPVTSRNGNKLSLAFNSSWEQIQISTTYMVFQVIKPNLLNCLYLELFFKQSWIDKIARYASTGTVRETLSFESFSRFPIVAPNLEVQEKIVNKYQTVTKYIEIKKRINELLERKMKAYFHILFDDLKDYEMRSFGELFAVIKGGRPPRSNRWLEELYFCKEGGIPYLQVTDVIEKNCKFVRNTAEQLTEQGFKKGNCSLVSPNDLILVSSARSQCSLGRVYVNSCNLTINSNFWAFSNNLARGGRRRYSLPIIFIYFLIKENIWKLKRLINGSTGFKSFNLKKFQTFEVKIPKNKELIDKFNNFCEPIFELQKNNEQIIQKLMRLQKCWIESLD